MSIAVQINPAHDVHQRLLDARRDHRQAEHTLAHLLAELANGELYLELGYLGYPSYAEEVLDLTHRQSRDLLHLGRALPDLPVLDRAFANGDLGWTKAREVVKVATPQTEAAWVERASNLTSRELERHISGCAYGDLPPDPREVKGPSRRRLMFDVEATDAELILNAIAHFRAQAGSGHRDLPMALCLPASPNACCMTPTDPMRPPANRIGCFWNSAPRVRVRPRSTLRSVRPSSTKPLAIMTSSICDPGRSKATSPGQFHPLSATRCFIETGIGAAFPVVAVVFTCTYIISNPSPWAASIRVRISLHSALYTIGNFMMACSLLRARRTAA